jgi:hypothetical protein
VIESEHGRDLGDALCHLADVLRHARDIDQSSRPARKDPGAPRQAPLSKGFPAPGKGDSVDADHWRELAPRSAPFNLESMDNALLKGIKKIFLHRNENIPE